MGKWWEERSQGWVGADLRRPQGGVKKWFSLPSSVAGHAQKREHYENHLRLLSRGQPG